MKPCVTNRFQPVVSMVSTVEGTGRGGASSGERGGKVSVSRDGDFEVM